MDGHVPCPVQVVIDGDRVDLPEDASDTAMEVDSDSQSTSVGSTSLSQPKVGESFGISAVHRLSMMWVHRSLSTRKVQARAVRSKSTLGG